MKIEKIILSEIIHTDAERQIQYVFPYMGVLAVKSSKRWLLSI